MTDIYICRKCGKDGILHEFFVEKKKRLPTSYLCKDCSYTWSMSDEEKKEYYEKKELLIIKKIHRLYSVPRPKYSLYARRLTPDDYPIKHPDGYLVVKCTYCGKPFLPKIQALRNRISAINGTASGESRLYCSDNCKKACPIFYANTKERTRATATSREVQSELRQLRLRIDNYRCQRCWASIEKKELHCHHITGVSQNPIESADLDNTITLCIDCHKKAHGIKGCSTFNLRCKKTNETVL
jgi:5-methylcytosine-specific restriction endonuclease McrA